MVPNPNSASSTAWTIRYAERILEDDLDEVGYAAFQVAKKAIEKKLKIAPDQYGESLHDPLHAFRKLKSSHIRIVYKVDPEVGGVLILMIGDRRDIWDTEQGEILKRYEQDLHERHREEKPPKKRKGRQG